MCICVCCLDGVWVGSPVYLPGLSLEAIHCSETCLLKVDKQSKTTHGFFALMVHTMVWYHPSTVTVLEALSQYYLSYMKIIHPNFLDPDFRRFAWSNVGYTLSWCNPSCGWVSACFHHSPHSEIQQSSVSLSFNSSGNNMCTASCASLKSFRNNWNVSTASRVSISFPKSIHFISFILRVHCDLLLRIELCAFVFLFVCHSDGIYGSPMDGWIVYWA